MKKKCLILIFFLLFIPSVFAINLLDDFNKFFNADNFGFITGDLIKSIEIPSQFNSIPNFKIENKLLLAGNIETVKVNPKKNNIILAIKYYPYNSSTGSGNYRQLFYSEDYGTTWIPKLNLNRIEIDKIDPSIVYGVQINFTIDKSIIYRSEDYGKNFVKVSEINGNNYESYPNSIFSDRFTKKKLYLGVRDKWGIYISNNGGNSFTFIPFSNSIKVPPQDLEITQKRIIWGINQDPNNKNILYTTGEQSTHLRYGRPFVYPHSDPYYTTRSIDGGLTWEAISNGLTWHSIGIIPINRNGRTMWLNLEEDPGIFNFNNTIWIPDTHNQELGYVHNYMVWPINNTIHIAVNIANIFVSQNNALNFTQVYKNWQQNVFFTDMQIDNSGNLYIVDFKNGLIKLGKFTVPSKSLLSLLLISWRQK